MCLKCWLIRMNGGQWTPASRSTYNLRDTVARCTTQVLPLFCQCARDVINYRDCRSTSSKSRLFFEQMQVYPRSWTAIYMALDNVGMWNIRSENWARQYLGQQFYLRVFSPANSWRDELPIPKNALLCGRARGRHTRPF